MVQFRKSKTFGGVRITASKKGIGVSAGAGPLRVSRGADGKVRRTVRAPGTGIYDTKVIGGKKAIKRASAQNAAPSSSGEGFKTFAIFAAIFIGIVLVITFWLPILIIGIVSLVGWISYRIFQKEEASRLDVESSQEAEGSGQIEAIDPHNDGNATGG
ncbi:DUF4236 domain-containing protein [Rhodococcus qingshengii]|uniref:DUF4236 domain-containing protein n=1 Tax=Rhodococcus qingshengii TaxID=334542 RepID=UPI0037C7EBF6